MKVIESMKEALLYRVFPANELNVVNKQDINGSIFFSKFRSGAVLDRGNKFISELL